MQWSHRDMDRDIDHGVATSNKRSFQIEKGQTNNRATQTIHLIQFQTGKQCKMKEIALHKHIVRKLRA
jgi:hypothetical protein